MHDIQIRDFIACQFLYLGLYYLLTDSAKWKIKYLILLILAILNHYLFVFFTLLLFSKKEFVKTKTFYQHFFVAIASLTVFFVYNREALGGLVNLMYLVDSEKAEIYSEISTRYGCLMFLAYQGYILWLLWIVNNKIRKLQIVAVPMDNIFKTSIYDNLLSINVLLSLIIPFIAIDFNFYRILRLMVLVNVAYLGNFIIIYRDRTILLLSVLYFYLWARIDILGANFERVERIFNNNTLSW